MEHPIKRLLLLKDCYYLRDVDMRFVKMLNGSNQCGIIRPRQLSFVAYI